MLRRSRWLCGKRIWPAGISLLVLVWRLTLNHCLRTNRTNRNSWKHQGKNFYRPGWWKWLSKTVRLFKFNFMYDVSVSDVGLVWGFLMLSGILWTFSLLNCELESWWLLGCRRRSVCLLPAAGGVFLELIVSFQAALARGFLSEVNGDWSGLLEWKREACSGGWGVTPSQTPRWRSAVPLLHTSDKQGGRPRRRGPGSAGSAPRSGVSSGGNSHPTGAKGVFGTCSVSAGMWVCMM